MGNRKVLDTSGEQRGLVGNKGILVGNGELPVGNKHVLVGVLVGNGGILRVTGMDRRAGVGGE